MKELTLYFEYCDWIGVDLKEYLLSLDGIAEVIIDTEDSYVHVKYDNEKIKREVVKYEILFCVDGLRFPIITAFDKHEKKDSIDNYTITIKDICCEYCFKGMIDDLFRIKGINSARSNFDYHNMFYVKVDITYDSSVITKKEILKIENDLNK